MHNGKTTRHTPSSVQHNAKMGSENLTYEKVKFLTSWVVGVVIVPDATCFNDRMKKPIRASDVGAFLYCRRAWWLAFKGVKVQDKEIMRLGRKTHDTFAGRVEKVEVTSHLAKRQTRIGKILLYVAAVLLLVFLILWLRR
jgi:cell division protein FtsL